MIDLTTYRSILPGFLYESYSQGVTYNATPLLEAFLETLLIKGPLCISEYVNPKLSLLDILKKIRIDSTHYMCIVYVKNIKVESA
jgi:hypothetical protein